MDGQITAQFRMKGRDQLIFLTGGHDLSVHRRQHLGIRRNRGDVRRPDKGHGDRADTFAYRLYVKAAQLPPVGIAFDCNIHRAETAASAFHFLGKKNQTRTGSEHRKPLLNLL